jgi:hypothetical protein
MPLAINHEVAWVSNAIKKHGWRILKLRIHIYKEEAVGIVFIQSIPSWYLRKVAGAKQSKNLIEILRIYDIYV